MARGMALTPQSVDERVQLHVVHGGRCGDEAVVGVVIDRRAVAQHLARSEHRDPIVGDLVQVDPTCMRCVVSGAC